MDSRLEGLFNKFASDESWKGKCVQKLREAVVDHGAQSIVGSLVGGDGDREVARNNATWKAEQVWGVNINTCYEYCSRGRFPMVFNYQAFLARATNYLLPWLALTAQLPYEGGSAKANIMSFCLSLGSPALATYSLMITILNQNWLRRLCESLPKYEDGENQIQNPYTQRMSSARILLEAAQQAPLQISDRDGSLSSLIILEANNSWWNSVEQRLKATKRSVTFSLVAQMVVAAGAWVLTVAGSFISSLGDHTEALVLSSSALWTWLVPVIWGWIAVGTQSASDTIDDTLSEFILVKAGRAGVPPHKTSNHDAFKVLKRLPNEQLPKFLIFNICGDEIQQGPTFNYARVFTWWAAAKAIHRTFDRVALKYNDREPLPGGQHPATGRAGLGGGLTNNGGSEPRPGSATTNTRAATARSPSREIGPEEYELQPIGTGSSRGVDTRDIGSSLGVDTLDIGSSRDVDAQNTGSLRVVNTEDTGSSRPVDPHDIVHIGASRVQSFRMRDLNGTVEQLNEYCGFGSHSHTQFARYPSWKEIGQDSEIQIRMFGAAFAGLLVQWGTTIPAVIIAYMTDVRGLGCRSGSYLVYGLAGTLAFFLLFTSTLFSHAAVLSHEAALARMEKPDGSNRPPHTADPERQQPQADETTGPGHYAGLKAWAFLAVSTRVFGQLVAIGNATWIILSSLWELVGFYDSCWCEGTVLSAGEDAWVVLFKQAVDLAERAEGSWAGGVAMSILVCFASWGVFVLLCKDVRQR
ncbi:hypothetical protein V8F20_002830 [Naviculisporaceae sp. PSN 640]